ncbi:MAG: hypothetical protein ACM3XN_05475 [Chloroflexota bacterium]
MAANNARTPVEDTETILFAEGAPAAIAALYEECGGQPPSLTRPLAEAIRTEIAALARTVGAATTTQAKAFVDRVKSLGIDGEDTLAETLITLLVLDGLTAPVIRQVALGDAMRASLLTVPASPADGTGPFLRACVRPSARKSAAVFCCGKRFRHSMLLERILMQPAVRLTLASISADRSLVLHQRAKGPLVQIGAIQVKRAFAETTYYATLPLLATERLSSLREPALTLARALLNAAGGPESLGAALLNSGTAALPEFQPAAALAAATGVFQHELAEMWHEAGVLPVPVDYRLTSTSEPAQVMPPVSIGS